MGEEWPNQTRILGALTKILKPWRFDTWNDSYSHRSDSIGCKPMTILSQWEHADKHNVPDEQVHSTCG